MRNLLAAAFALSLVAVCPAFAQSVAGGGCPVGASSCTVTATDGTTALTLSNIEQKVLTVDDFGAKGDGTTDDTVAFNAYTTYLLTQAGIGKPQNAWILGFGKRYFVAQSVNLTGFTHYRFEGNGSFILSSEAATLAVVNAQQSGTTLTINSVASGTVRVGSLITGAGIDPEFIAALGTGTGGAGTYTVTLSRTIAAQTMQGAYGHPAVDMLQTNYSYLENLHIQCGSQGAPCFTGITFGMAADSPPEGQNTFHNVEIDGYYAEAAAQNSNSEVFTWEAPLLTNRYTSGIPGSTYVMIEDGGYQFPLNSRYQTDTRTLNTTGSFMGEVFINGSMEQVGDGSVLYEAGGSREHFYLGTYMHVVSTSAPISKWYFVTNGTNGTEFRDIRWWVHSEINQQSIIQFNGYATPSVFGLDFDDPNPQVNNVGGSIFAAGTGLTRIMLQGARLDLHQFQNAGGTVFDAPSKYGLSGTVWLNSASHTSWTAPGQGCNIDLWTDAIGSFTFGCSGRIGDPSNTLLGYVSIQNASTGITIQNHLQSSNSPPTVGTGAGDCGTSPVIAGTDDWGRITVGSSTNGGKCTVTFAAGWTNPPVCTVANETSGARSVFPTAAQATLTIKAASTLTAGDSLVYHCLGY